MKFRKKPVVIEAVQYDGHTVHLPYEMGTAITRSKEGGSCFIDTKEGTMECRPNDWIIRGIKGELYPCKPDIFAATYEPADTPGDTANLAAITAERDALAASCAVMRRALESHKRTHSQMDHHEDCDLSDCGDCAYAWEPCEEHPDAVCDCCLDATTVEAALASDAGRAFLAERDALRIQLDAADDLARAAYNVEVPVGVTPQRWEVALAAALSRYNATRKRI